MFIIELDTGYKEISYCFIDNELLDNDLFI
jgi:hypothetical protein